MEYSDIFYIDNISVDFHSKDKLTWEKLNIITIPPTIELVEIDKNTMTSDLHTYACFQKAALR